MFCSILHFVYIACIFTDMTYTDWYVTIPNMSMLEVWYSVTTKNWSYMYMYNHNIWAIIEKKYGLYMRIPTVIDGILLLSAYVHRQMPYPLRKNQSIWCGNDIKTKVIWSIFSTTVTAAVYVPDRILAGILFLSCLFVCLSVCLSVCLYVCLLSTLIFAITFET